MLLAGGAYKFQIKGLDKGGEFQAGVGEEGLEGIFKSRFQICFHGYLFLFDAKIWHHVCQIATHIKQICTNKNILLQNFTLLEISPRTEC